jgi:hypothetical protein
MVYHLLVLTCLLGAPGCQAKPSPGPGALSDPSPEALPDPIPVALPDPIPNPNPDPIPLPSPSALAIPGKLKAVKFHCLRISTLARLDCTYIYSRCLKK